MKRKYLILTLLFITAISVQSQVKIGGLAAPNKFSALEIENIGKGLRLPQLTVSQQDKLTDVIEGSTDITLAGGLLIYNVTSHNLQMWRDATSKWVPLPMTGRCTVAQTIAITAKSALTLSEYGTENLELEATIVGNSANADPYFEWFLNNKQVGSGQVYKIPKERLSFRDAGSYTVRVISCSATASASSKASAPVVVTINEL